MDYANPWIYKKKPVTDETVEEFTAFVYCITNLSNGKKYIGKKRLKFIKTKSVKKKKKRIKVPSDWKEYYSSCDELKIDVEKLGENNFKREILRFCKTLAEASYWEAKYQFENDVLLSDDWYNGWIMVRVRKSKSLLEIDDFL